MKPTTDLVNVQVRMPRDAATKIRMIAAAEGLSASRWCLSRLEPIFGSVDVAIVPNQPKAKPGKAVQAEVTL